MHKGKRYGVHNVQELLQSLPNKGKNVGIQVKGDVCAFLGKHCPLSIFFKCDIELAGVHYSSVEQGYQVAKTKYHGRDDLANIIMSKTDPLEIKHVCQSLPDQDWYQSGDVLKAMSELVNAKFIQSSLARDVLLQHAGKQFAEASKNDRYWGAGVSRGEKGIWDPVSYRGQNQMGKLLNRVQSKIMSG